MNLVNVRSGKANASSALSECFVFVLPHENQDATVPEDFIGKVSMAFRNTPNAPIKGHGSPTVMPSLLDTPQSIGGTFAQASYLLQDGVVLKIILKKRVGWNGTMRSAVMFLKAREHAAHRQFKFYPVANNALSLDWLGVQGRFDVISLDEAEAFGFRISAITEKMYSVSDPTMIETVTLEPETMAPVGFVTVAGKMIPTLKRRRIIESV